MGWQRYGSSGGKTMVQGTQRFTTLGTAGSQAFGLRKTLTLPLSDHPLLARIRLTPSVTGRLARVFYRVPEVELIAFTERGRMLASRVVPDVLADGVPANFLPAGMDDLRDLLASTTVRDPVRKIIVTGEGADLFEPLAQVEFASISELRPAASSFGIEATGRDRELDGRADEWRGSESQAGDPRHSRQGRIRVAARLGVGQLAEHLRGGRLHGAGRKTFSGRARDAATGYRVAVSHPSVPGRGLLLGHAGR